MVFPPLIQRWHIKWLPFENCSYSVWKGGNWQKVKTYEAISFKNGATPAIPIINMEHVYRNKRMAAKVKDSIHTEQSTRDVFLEHRRRIIYHTAFSCKNLGERKKKKLKSKGENWVIILKLMLSFSGGNKKAARTKHGTKSYSAQLL